MQRRARGRGPRPSDAVSTARPLPSRRTTCSVPGHGSQSYTGLLRYPLQDVESRAEAGLTIGAVAARTGLSVPVLRVLGAAARLPPPRAARRRPSPLRRRRRRSHPPRGRGGAGRAARWRPPSPSPGAVPSRQAPTRDLDGTIYAGLRRRRPDLEVHVLSRRAMLALSHAIEDECLALRRSAPRSPGPSSASRPTSWPLPRWRELGRTAASALVFADFDRSRTRDGVHQIAIAPERPARPGVGGRVRRADLRRRVWPVGAPRRPVRGVVER